MDPRPFRSAHEARAAKLWGLSVAHDVSRRETRRERVVSPSAQAEHGKNGRREAVGALVFLFKKTLVVRSARGVARSAPCGSRPGDRAVSQHCPAGTPRSPVSSVIPFLHTGPGEDKGHTQESHGPTANRSPMETCDRAQPSSHRRPVESGAGSWCVFESHPVSGWMTSRLNLQ